MYKAKNQLYKSQDDEESRSLALFEAAMKRADAIEAAEEDVRSDDDYSDDEEDENDDVNVQQSKSLDAPGKIVSLYMEVSTCILLLPIMLITERLVILGASDSSVASDGRAAKGKASEDVQDDKTQPPKENVSTERIYCTFKNRRICRHLQSYLSLTLYSRCLQGMQVISYKGQLLLQVGLRRKNKQLTVPAALWLLVLLLPPLPVVDLVDQFGPVIIKRKKTRRKKKKLTRMQAKQLVMLELLHLRRSRSAVTLGSPRAAR